MAVAHLVVHLQLPVPLVQSGQAHLNREVDVSKNPGTRRRKCCLPISVHAGHPKEWGTEAGTCFRKKRFMTPS